MRPDASTISCSDIHGVLSRADIINSGPESSLAAPINCPLRRGGGPTRATVLAVCARSQSPTPALASAYAVAGRGRPRVQSSTQDGRNTMVHGQFLARVTFL